MCEQENKIVGADGLSASERRLRALSSPGQRYVDKWGEQWVRQNCDYVVRLSDGNIGQWQNGRSLTHLAKNKI